MLNQSYSADNFRKILDLENRKGNFLEGKYFSSLEDITEQVKLCNKQIKEKKKSKSASKDELKKLYEQRKDLNKEKEKQLNSKLQAISEKVLASGFKIEMTKKEIPGKKTLYVVADSPEHYFTIKQLQSNVSRLFGVKQANRFDIISQVKALLSDKFPKYVLRTDISDFYENIPHEWLLKKINGDNLLSPFSRKLLVQILTKYKHLSGSDKGVPRGIGVSAYLAELYMRDIDQKIMASRGISYYARYVDDIFIIFVPNPDDLGIKYLNDIEDIIEIKYKLSLNKDKTHCFDLRNKQDTYELEYLGYKISFGDGKIKTRFTDKKISKYKFRIDTAFKNYLYHSKVNEKMARKLLIKRMRFLTGNTRLKNNKNNILVGIYHSNSQLTEKEDLLNLDLYFKEAIDKYIKITTLKERLLQFSFEVGFDNKKFSPFKTHELYEIMKVWK
jgi:hypothetical protein